MADTKQTPNPTMQNDTANTGRSDKAEQGSLNKDHANEDHANKGEFSGDKNREKSAIGGSQAEPRSETGEPGRARNELDQNKNETAGGTQR